MCKYVFNPRELFGNAAKSQNLIYLISEKFSKMSHPSLYHICLMFMYILFTSNVILAYIVNFRYLVLSRTLYPHPKLSLGLVPYKPLS